MITTHVLDTGIGKPASGVAVALSIQDGETWRLIGSSRTNADGRARDICPEGVSLAAGVYRISFDTGAYFRESGQAAFYPLVEITFSVTDGAAHYHVPLLLSPWGYTTYRGS